MTNPYQPPRVESSRKHISRSRFDPAVLRLAPLALLVVYIAGALLAHVLGQVLGHLLASLAVLAIVVFGMRSGRQR